MVGWCTLLQRVGSVIMGFYQEGSCLIWSKVRDWGLFSHLSPYPSFPCHFLWDMAPHDWNIVDRTITVTKHRFMISSNVSFLKWIDKCECDTLSGEVGVIGWGKGVVYLMSPGRPTEIGYSWARPAILAEVRVEGNLFISSVTSLSFIFLFLLCPSLTISFSSTISSISFSLGDNTKMTHKGWRVIKPQHNQSVSQGR